MPATKKSSRSKSGSSKSSESKSGASKSSRSKSGGSKTAGSKSSTAKTSKSSTAKSGGSRSASAKSNGSAAQGKSSTTSSRKTTSKSKSPSASKRTSSTSRAKSTASRRSSKSDGKGVIATAIEAVTGIFSGGAQDAISLLKEDHRKVESLFEKVKANEDGNNAATFKKIKEELDVHAHIEEAIFYPHLLDKGDKELKKIVREGFEEHAQVKDLLVEIAALSGDSPTFKAKLKVLMENVEHHVEEEEDEMFPMVEDQIPEDTRVRLGSLMQGEKVKVNKMTPAAKGRKASAAGQR